LALEQILNETKISYFSIALCSRQETATAIARKYGTTRENLYNWRRALLGKRETAMPKQQKELLRHTNSRKGFDSIVDKIEELRDEKHRLRLEDANNYGAKARIKELEETSGRSVRVDRRV